MGTTRSTPGYLPLEYQFLIDCLQDHEKSNRNNGITGKVFEMMKIHPVTLFYFRKASSDKH